MRDEIFEVYNRNVLRFINEVTFFSWFTVIFP